MHDEIAQADIDLLWARAMWSIGRASKRKVDRASIACRGGARGILSGGSHTRAIYWRAAAITATPSERLLLAGWWRATFRLDDQPTSPRYTNMSWALDEFFAAVEDEFGVAAGDEEFLETPGAVVDFIVDNTSPPDGMDGQEHRDHVAGVLGEIMARTLGITRYSDDSRFIQDLHVR